MENKDFDYGKIWDIIAKPEIDRIISLSSKKGLQVRLYESEAESKKLLISRYITERDKFKKSVMLNPKGLSDRHKIAALFYVAFTYKMDDKMNKFPFIVFDKNSSRNVDADTIITHNVAYDISIGILESFALSDEKTPEIFKDYVRKNGLGEPKIICNGKTKDNYEKQTIKQLIHAQRENKLSVALLSNIFFSIDNNSRLVADLSNP